MTNLKSDGNRSRGQRDKVLVCSPDPNNITIIFVPLMIFIEEIEHALGLKSGSKCALNSFLSDYMTEKFLGQHKANIQQQVDAAVRVADAWKATTLPDTTREKKPLLQVFYSGNFLLSPIFYSLFLFCLEYCNRRTLYARIPRFNALPAVVR